MNLIRNTLFSVVLLQLLAAAIYMLFFKSSIPEKTTQIIIPSKQILSSYTVKSSLPISTQYSIEEKKVLKEETHKIAKVTKEATAVKLAKVMLNVPLAKVKNINTDKKIERYAKNLLGHKYVWGATGPDTFDCSGFTQKVYRKSAGIKLPRVSREQAKVGKYIEYEKLKKGDMVFFDTEKEYTKRVNHVGIYLGSQKFIHASSARKKVIITSFRKRPFYKRRFLWGRRVLKEDKNINIAMLLKEALKI